MIAAPVPWDAVDDLQARRAASFGDAAAAYARHRPGYPQDAVAWALAPGPAATAPDEPRRVLDLAAGTGKLTEAVLRCAVPANRLLAVEPDAQMRAELARLLPDVELRAGSAERIPAADGAFDTVLVAQAFHWFEPDRALTEIARVLRPGGVLAVMGNAPDDSVEWVSALMNASEQERSVRGPGRGFSEVPAHPAFGSQERRRFPWRWPRTVDSWLQTVRTHSWALVSSDEDREAGLAAIRTFLERNPATRGGSFELPWQTVVARLPRLA